MGINQNEQPMSMEIEIRCIGALLNIGIATNHKAQSAMVALTDNHFHNRNTREIYKIIKSEFEDNNPFDAVSISGLVSIERFEFFQHTLRGEYFTANTLDYDVKQLEYYLNLRNQLRILHQALDLGSNEPSPQKAIEEISACLRELSSSSKQLQACRTYEQIADEALSSDVDSSFVSIDIAGLPPVPTNGLIIIAGRSGHGKTFKALNFMDKLIDALPDKQALYFNLEMDEVVMLQRHAIILGGTGNTRNEVIKSKLPELLNKNVNLFTVPMITIEEIETHARLAALRKPINVIVVDYVNLVTMKKRGESNSLDQNEIAKRLAALALDLNCTVIGLLQVNRASNNRPVGERIPQVADAADSMGSVKSATWWIGIDQPQKDDPDPTFRDLYQLACRKNRHGDNFYIDFDFKNGMFFKRETTFQQYASQKPMREHVYSPFKS